MFRKDRFYEIDLLRFLAALCVLLFHYTFRGTGPDHRSDLIVLALAPVFKYGYLGVELFFIISGFVILLTSLNHNAREFVISRVTRLYPAYWFCVTLTFVTTLTFGGSRFTATNSQYFVNLTMLQDFLKIPPIDGVYWTLTVELKFYLLIFILILIGRAIQIQYFLVFWLVATIFLSHVEGYNIFRFILVPGYSFFFISGATFLLIRTKGVSVFRLILIGISYIEAVRFAIIDSKDFSEFFKTDFDPLVITLIITIFFVLFFFISIGKTSYLNHHSFLSVGVLTYPLYLLHQNIGFMIFNYLDTYFNPLILFFTVIILMVFVSYSVHRWVELRCAKHLKRMLLRLLLSS